MEIRNVVLIENGNYHSLTLRLCDVLECINNPHTVKVRIGGVEIARRDWNRSAKAKKNAGKGIAIYGE